MEDNDNQWDPNFKEAIKLVFKHEGVFSDDPNDHGGPTQYGISLRFLKDLPKEFGDINHDGTVNIEDVKSLTRGGAMLLYYKEFWCPLNLAAIRHPWVAVKVFDMAVTMGVKRAAMLLQRAFNDVSPIFHLAVDGKIGPKSIDAINCINAENLLKAFQERCTEFYRTIVRYDASQSKWLKGWLNRVYSYS